MSDTRGIPAVYMRGGTSKGVFLHARDLPPAGADRDELLLKIMGSPDPMQIDGMGGTFSSTSKVVVVETAPSGEIVYWFAQVGVETRLVDWSGNCGNLTTAVAPFAIDEGLLTVPEGRATVRLRNGNTGVVIEADVEVQGGRARTTGDLSIAGVPGTGSPVTTRYLDPAGGVLGALLPTGAPTTRLESADGIFSVSIVDAAHPYVFAAASAFGLAGNGRRAPAEINADPELLDRVERLRSAAAVIVGAATTAGEASSMAPATPRIVLVEPGGAGADVGITAFSMARAHRALPMTGALCLAAAAAVQGTVVADAVAATAAAPPGADTGSRPLRIRHPLGVTEVVAELQPGERPIRSLGIVRTARRIMEGRVFPRESP